MRKLAFLLFAASIGISGFLLTNSSTQGQQNSQQDPDDVPTIVKIGNRTEKEKKYSKEYKKLYPNQNQKLTDGITLAKSRGYSGVITKSLGIPMIPTIGTSPTAKEFLANLACKSDAIVFGAAKSKTSHLTDNESWVYTEYEFAVKDVLKDNSALSIPRGGTIQITRPGGFVKLDGHVFRIKDSLYEQLKKNMEYVLFLSFVPSTEGYLVSNPKGDFKLQGNKFKGLSKIGLPEELNGNLDVQQLIGDLRDAVSANCSRTTEGGK